MALKTTVIISEVTNLSDARYCAGMGVDYIGFRIDKDHDKYVDLTNYKEITNWIAGIRFLGETSNIETQHTKQYNMDQMLIDNIDLLPHHTGQPALWTIAIDELGNCQSNLSDYQSKIKGIILKSEEPELRGPQKTKIKALASKFDVYLSFGINPYNILNLINELPIKGIYLRGSDEIRTGYKDYNELADILEELEVID